MNSGEIMLVDIIATVGKPNQVAPEPAKIVAGDSPAPRYGQVNAKPTSNHATSSTGQASAQAEEDEDEGEDGHGRAHVEWLRAPA